MSNEDLPPNAELASAYLDGELDTTERAAAAADAGVMEVIDSFARVRAAIGEVEPAAANSKDAAIAAALAEFDAIHATSSPSGAAPKVISLQSRHQRAYRVLTGVAAAIVIAVVGIAALNARGQVDNDSASSATVAPAADQAGSPELKTATESAAAATAADGTAAASDAGASTESATAAVPSIDTAAGLQQFAQSVEADSRPVAAPAGTAAPVGTAAPAADQATAAGGDAAPSCLTSDQISLGLIVFQGTFAFAVRDTSTGALLAIADTDCRVLIEVPATAQP
jgi:transcription termination factor Rho